MSRIDELQRLHEAVRNPGPFDGPGAWESLTGGLFHSWPAIHRVLLAARRWEKAPLGSLEEVIAGNEIVDSVRALDGDKGAT